VLAEHKTAHRSGRKRVLYLSARAQEILGGMTPKRQGLIFPNGKGGVLSRKTIGGIVARAILRMPKRQRPAYSGVTPYTLRRSRATHLIESGTDPATAAMVLGNSPTVLLTSYTWPAPEHVKKALDA